MNLTEQELEKLGIHKKDPRFNNTINNEIKNYFLSKLGKDQLFSLFFKIITIYFMN